MVYFPFRILALISFTTSLIKAYPMADRKLEVRSCITLHRIVLMSPLVDDWIHPAGAS